MEFLLRALEMRAMIRIYWLIACCSRRHAIDVSATFLIRANVQMNNDQMIYRSQCTILSWLEHLAALCISLPLCYYNLKHCSAAFEPINGCHNATSWRYPRLGKELPIWSISCLNFTHPCWKFFHFFVQQFHDMIRRALHFQQAHFLQ